MSSYYCSSGWVEAEGAYLVVARVAWVVVHRSIAVVVVVREEQEER
jgi:hypothetical protein